MIKVAIYGAGEPMAGELIRLLVTHPDVDITQLIEPSVAGLPVTDKHYGLVGETNACFTDGFDPKDADVLFICRTGAEAERELAVNEADSELRIIDMRPGAALSETGAQMVYGLPEIYRKPLVRGARRAALPSPAASLPLVALYPLAANLMLNPQMQASISVSEEIAELIDGQRVSEEVNNVLSSVQNSMEHDIDLPFETTQDDDTTMRFIAEMPCSTGLEQIREMYESIYDDHNFTFMIDRDPAPLEVAATSRILIHLSAPKPQTLRVSAIADVLTRGGAAEAVHLMNLLFGLYERTGLTLKAPASPQSLNYNNVR